MAGSWRRLHDEELHNLYASSNIVGVIKSRRVRWTGDVARMRGEMHTKFWLENLKGRDHSEDLATDGRIILTMISDTQGRKVCNGCIWVSIGTTAGSCQQGNEPSVSIIGGEFLD
jgi:hypothetical protein